MRREDDESLSRDIPVCIRIDDFEECHDQRHDLSSMSTTSEKSHLNGSHDAMGRAMKWEDPLLTLIDENDNHQRN